MQTVLTIKVRTIHSCGNAEINDSNILYFNENEEKRTRKWFQVCGNSAPLNGSQFEFIRNISYDNSNRQADTVKTQTTVGELSIKTENVSKEYTGLRAESKAVRRKTAYLNVRI